MDAAFISVWLSLFHQLSPAFSQPTSATIIQFMSAWALCRARPRVTSIFSTMGAAKDDPAIKHWTVYQKLFYRASWEPRELFGLLLTKIVLPLLDQLRCGQTAPGGPPTIDLVLDETTTSRWGRSVAFAGNYRDASMSNATSKVIRWGNCWLVGAIIINNPLWPRWVTALPIAAELHRKPEDCAEDDFKTTSQMAAEVIARVAKAAPDHRIRIVADGGFANSKAIGSLPPKTDAVVRIRSDATLFDLKKTSAKPRRGRPSSMGQRLPKPHDMAERRKKGWKTIEVFTQGGKPMTVEILSVVCLWPTVRGDQPIRLLMMRDPEGKRPLGYLCCTDPNVDATEIVQRYCHRWAIEECFREAKQQVGMENVQGWCARTVLRQVPLALVLQTLIKVWYMKCGVSATEHQPKTESRPWYTPPTHPSFLRMMATLRSVLWQERLKGMSLPKPEMDKLFAALRFTLAEAA